MHPLLNIATQAARNASKIITRFMDRLDSIQVSEKGRNDLVTEVDRLAEQEIIATIQKNYPNHSILAEESGFIKGTDVCWVIDPLDGTTNYAHGFPHFAVSIAVKDRERLEIGLVYDPIRQDLFTTARGEGAHLNHRRIRVSKCQKLENALIGTGFPFRETQDIESYLKTFAKIIPVAQGIRRAGAASLDLAYVAAGFLDGFWEAGLHEWDMAAGTLMIREAGGWVSDFTGKENHLSSGNIVAGNLPIYNSLLAIIKPE